MTEEIGTWSTNGKLTGFDEFSGKGMFRGSNSYKTCLSSDDCWQNIEISLENYGERSRPILFCEELINIFLFWTHLD